ALGHTLQPVYPALTPLTGAMPGDANLAGISLAVRIKAKADGKTRESAGGFLFTHRGYSGPSVLDVSHVAVRSQGRAGATLRVSWTERGEAAWAKELTDTSGRVAGVVARHLPERLAEALCSDAG